MEVKELRSQRPRAWTAILAQEPEMADIVVTRVAREKMTPYLTRFVLELADHSEPITLIGKETNKTEALFYRELSRRLPYLVPRCWFSHVHGEHSWIVLDDSISMRPPHLWTPSDAETVVQGLASLHVEFWDREDLLDQPIWLRHPLEGIELDQRYLLRKRVLEQRAYYTQLDIDVTLSDHAIWSLGSLAPQFLHAAAAVSFLQKRGGWPGVLEIEHLEMAAELLDDPMPMLYTLRDQPLTLQHGAPLNHHWHITLFSAARLFDWQQISAGPGITDLVHLVEQFNWVLDEAELYVPRAYEVMNEETLIDSYILHLAAELGPLCDTRAVRQSIAAARCFHLLSYWLPRFTDWFIEARREGHTLPSLDDAHLLKADFAPVLSLKPMLTATMQRFAAAARML